MKLVILLSLIAMCFALASRDPALFADGENYAEYMDLVLAGPDVNAEPSFHWIVAMVDALCLVAAPVVLVAFRDMPVIGARLADMLLFFSPLMVFGLYATRRAWGRVLFLAMLTVQVVNLAFFSTVILL